MQKTARNSIALAIIVVAAGLSPWTARGADAVRASSGVAATGLSFPEGTIFVGDELYFVDYTRSSVLRLDGSTPVVVWHQDGCGANGLLAVPGGLMVACFDAGTVVGISMAGATLTTIHLDDHGRALEAPNDLAVDRTGGIYVSDSGAGGDLGRVLYIAPGHAPRNVASGIGFANGIGVSPDGGTLYVAESPTGKLLAFPIAADGALGVARVLIALRDILPAAPGGPVTPDSLRVDRHGNVLAALYDGGGIAIVSQEGKLLRLLDVPSQHHTNLAISPDGESLYVTAIDDGPQSTYRGQIVWIANPFPN